MLHPVPDSSLRRRLMRIVVIQRKLVRALCALPAGSTVDQAWLTQQAWPHVDADWVRRFWENQKGRRQAWLNAIAATDAATKQDLLRIMEEQHRFRGLYDDPPTQQMQHTDRAFWNANPVRQAMRDLMLDFYEPWLGQNLGYPAAVHGGAESLTRPAVVRAPVLRVCPYCDNGLQCAELDHFLPKSAFPFLSVHPDNLIPACHDSNRGDHKGDDPPLDWRQADQAADWFHPRWRSARDRFRLRFGEQPDHSLMVGFEAVDPAERQRVVNLDAMFRLAEFWGRAIGDDVQQVQKEVADSLRFSSQTGTADNARNQLRQLQHQHAQRVGDRPLHIYYTALYEFVLNTESLITDILTQYHEDVAA